MRSWCTITSHKTSHTRYYILWSCFLQENRLLVPWWHLHSRKSSKMGLASSIAICSANSTLLIYWTINEPHLPQQQQKKGRLRCYTESEVTPAQYSDMHCSKLFRIFIATFWWCCGHLHQAIKVQNRHQVVVYMECRDQKWVRQLAH